MRIKVGDIIEIISVQGKPQYSGKTGDVIHVDADGRLHGTWGSLTLIPGKDDFIVRRLEAKTHLDIPGLQREHIELPQYYGTWCIVDEKLWHGEPVFLLELEKFSKWEGHLIVDSDFNVILDDVDVDEGLDALDDMDYYWELYYKRS